MFSNFVFPSAIPFSKLQRPNLTSRIRSNPSFEYDITQQCRKATLRFFVVKEPARCCNVYLAIFHKFVFSTDFQCCISYFQMYQTHILFVEKADGRCCNVFLQAMCFLRYFDDVYVLLEMLQIHDTFVVITCDSLLT